MDDIGKIADIELKGLRKRIAEAGYRLYIPPSVKKLILESGYDPAYGARPLKRSVRKYVEDPVSDFIISNGPASGPGLKRLYITAEGMQTKAVMKD